VAFYPTDRAAGRDLRASTIRRRLAVISQLHKEVGLTGQAVTRMIQKHARAAGLDGKRYSAHSLRATLVTGASTVGVSEKRVSEKRIMDQTGHRSLPLVHRYTREADLFKCNPAAHLGL
jgi:integrase